MSWGGGVYFSPGTINQLFDILREKTQSEVKPHYRETRSGDIRDSLADISLAHEFIGYAPQTKVKQGLEITVEWFKKTYYS